MIVQALPVADILEHDGQALVLTEGTLLRLSGLGAAVLRLAVDGIETDRLLDALTEEFGSPESGSAQDALGQVLEALASQRLILLTPSA